MKIRDCSVSVWLSGLFFGDIRSWINANGSWECFSRMLCVVLGTNRVSLIEVNK